MLAKINGDRIECGGCGGLLAKFRGDALYKNNDSEITWHSPTFNMLRGTQEGKPHLEIKCKARKNGVSCNQINEIQL